MKAESPEWKMEMSTESKSGLSPSRSQGRTSPDHSCESHHTLWILLSYQSKQWAHDVVGHYWLLLTDYLVMRPGAGFDSHCMSLHPLRKSSAVTKHCCIQMARHSEFLQYVCTVTDASRLLLGSWLCTFVIAYVESASPTHCQISKWISGMDSREQISAENKVGQGTYDTGWLGALTIWNDLYMGKTWGNSTRATQAM